MKSIRSMIIVVVLFIIVPAITQHHYRHFLGVDCIQNRVQRMHYFSLRLNNSATVVPKKLKKQDKRTIKKTPKNDNKKTKKKISAKDVMLQRFGKFKDIIEKKAGEYAPVVAAMIEKESSFIPTAIGRDGEIGLMQVKLSTAKGIRGDIGAEDLLDPATNIEIGTEYLKKQLNRFKSIEAALQCYNAGPESYKRGAPLSTEKYANDILLRRKIYKRYIEG